jgi:soluble lytic murein transglycosylase-like protein
MSRLRPRTCAAEWGQGTDPGSRTQSREPLNRVGRRPAGTSLARLLGLTSLALLLSWLTACSKAPVPSLRHAFAVKGPPAVCANAFLRVAIEGREPERARAAFLWGILACEAHSPQSALAGFDLAQPSGARALLAAHRLEEALTTTQAPGELWLRAARAGWLPAADRSRFRLCAAEAFAMRGAQAAAEAALPPLTDLDRDEVSRALAIVAHGTGPGAAAAQRRLAIDFPQAYAALYPPDETERLVRSLTTTEQARRAQAWLDLGQPRTALKEAAHAGAPGYVVAARAALRLRHASAAAAWAARGGEGCNECVLERVEAERQRAWAASPPVRSRRFTEMLRSAERLDRHLPANSPLAGRAHVLLAEALTETGAFARALALLREDAVRDQPRWEWVCRRWLYLQATARAPATWDLGGSTRLQRLAAFWTARAAAARGDTTGLRALADSGFPDLPALWAAELLHRRDVMVALGDETSRPPAPPAWAHDLLAIGRVGDAVFGWRAELAAAGANGPAWLGVAALAGMPPLEAIPLLLRGEPRLLSGPWSGLPRDLLQRYLPLPWRREVEAAARRTGVPPWVLAGLARQESAWNPRARSAAGAQGLTQVLPEVGEEVARSVPGIARHGDLLEPERNLTLGGALLARWRGDFGGSWEAALACYNAGERRIAEIWQRTGHRGGPEFVEALEIPENWDYVHRVVLLAEGYRLLYWPQGEAYPWT